MRDTVHQADGVIAAIFGMPGAGKTTLSLLFAQRAQEAGRPTIVYDPTHDVRKALTERLDVSWAVVTRFDAASRVKAATRHRSGAVLVLSERQPLWDLAHAGLLRECTCVLDECHQLFPSQGMRESGRQYLELNRNRGIESIVIAKRPQDVHTSVRTSAAHVFVFRQQSRGALKCLQDCADESCWESAVELPKFSFLYRPPWMEQHDAELETWALDDVSHESLPYGFPEDD